METPIKFVLPATHNQKQLISEMSRQYGIITEKAQLERISIYDTFDWRLFNRSWVLFASGARFNLRRLYENRIIHSAEIDSPCVFIEDFPEGDLKKLLAPTIKMRALVKLVDIYSRSISFRILNRDQKTVARLAYEKIQPNRATNSAAIMSYLWLKPVKGYPRYARDLAQRFHSAGFKSQGREDFYFKALELTDQKPGSYSSKLKIKLQPGMRSDAATKIILRHLLQVIRINEPYIAKALDTEFLHDYRVAIRRTRSALSQIKNIFPKQTTSRFKRDFAFMGKLSNQLRDLDVYLLNENAYKAMLPEVLREDIDPLFDYLRQKRATVLKQVLKNLRSRKYKQIQKDWAAFLDHSDPATPTESNAELDILALAQRRIYKQYRSTIKSGRRILENTEDEKLHALRIECKKLRYLMEFFTSLFAQEKIKRLIKQLKKLQDNLGTFNDLSIQEQYLLSIAQEMPAGRRRTPKMLVAIGSLVGALDAEKKAVKQRFAKIFQAYASPINQRVFRELFASKKKKDDS